MEPTQSHNPVLYNPHSPARKMESCEYKASSVQLFSPQQAALTNNRNRHHPASGNPGSILAKRSVDNITTPIIYDHSGGLQPGPQYDLKETPSGDVWERNDSVKILSVEPEHWPMQLTPKQMTERYGAGEVSILYFIPDSDNTVIVQNRKRQDAAATALQPHECGEKAETRLPLADLSLRLPESNERTDWLFHFYNHPGQVIENSLQQAFGVQGAHYIESQLDQLDDERAETWKEICKLLKANKTCSFPYRAGHHSPEPGKQKDIILDMLLIQSGNPCDKKALAMHTKMCTFLTQEGIQGRLAYKHWPSKVVTYRGGFMAQNQSVPPGTIQFFLTTHQVRQLFLALRTFVTSQTATIQQKY